MTSQEKSEKSAGMSRRAFVGLTAAAGVAAGFLVGWLVKPGAVEEIVKTVTQTSTLTTTAPGGTVTTTVTQPGGAGATATVTQTATATVTTTVAAGPLPPEPVPLRRVVSPQKGYHIVVDYNRCTGCRLCEFECATKYQPDSVPGVNLEYSRIRPERFLQVDMPIHCNYCHLEEWVEGTTKHPCEIACPFAALQVVTDVKEADKVGNGYRWVDESKCTGLEACGRCLEICEEQFGSGMVALPPDSAGIMKVVTCTMCAGKPACVNACPEQTLRFEPPQQDGRYYAQRPTDLAEMLYMKLYKLRRKLR